MSRTPPPPAAVLSFENEDPAANENADRGRLIVQQERAARDSGAPLGSWLESGGRMFAVPHTGGAAAAFLAHRWVGRGEQTGGCRGDDVPARLAAARSTACCKGCAGRAAMDVMSGRCTDAVWCGVEKQLLHDTLES